MAELEQTLGALRASAWGRPPLLNRGVKDELRGNLIARLRAGEPVFKGILGYDDTVVPGLVNSVLSRHNFILLGLRGQAKSRILRGLAELLDERVPAIAGCEIHDDPFRPVCAGCRSRIAEAGDDTPITWLPRDARYVEKLATPDVTVADLIGDLDPIRAAKEGLSLADERTIHYGLLPRSNRGLFAVNELPDLAGKVQVSLFNIMQEGDVQIKGYPIRLNLDIALMFTANPEDYTARGKIITPLKDRIGSEIRTHYPASLEIGMRITEAEAWSGRTLGGDAAVRVVVPDYLREVVEGIAFVARDDSRIDKRSGVSQRLPITCLENVISNAERRALTRGEGETHARIADLYASLPAVTGKIELEYEGELKGSEAIGRELVRGAVARSFDRRLNDADGKPVVDWFEGGGMLRLDDEAPAADCLAEFASVPELVPLAQRVTTETDPGAVATAAEFVLEGLYGKRLISRSEERLYMKAEPVLSERDLHHRGGNRYGFDGDLM